MIPDSRIAFLEKRVEELEAREALLVAQKEQLRQLYDRAPLSYQSLDEDGCFIDINQTWLDTIGYSREEVIGSSFSDFLPLDSQQHFRENFPKFKNVGEVLGVEFDIVKKDGGVITISLYGKIGKDSKGHFQQTHCIIHDITAHRQAQNALLQSEALHRTLVAAIPDLVWLKDAKGVYLNCNKAFERFFGSTELTIVGKTDYDFLTKDLADSFRMHDEKAMESIGSGVNEEQLTFAEGSYVGLFATIKTAMRDEDGNTVGVLGIARDITERVEAESRLRESEQKFKSLFERAADAIYLLSIDGQILDVNKAALKQIGYSREELLTMTVGDLDPQALDENYQEKIWENFDDDGVESISTYNTRKDGSSFPVEVGLSKVEVLGELVLLAFVRDVTVKFEIENQLRQSQKLEAIGTLAGGIAHDFNNMLAGILGFAELALISSPPDSKNRQNIGEILVAGHRAKELVKQILTFSKQGQSEKCHFQPAVIVQEAIKFLRASLPTTIVLKQKIDVDSGVLYAEPTQIHQILVNLCTNAYHAMEESGGVINVSLEKVTLSLQDLENNSHVQPGKFVKLSVEDNGAGIDDKILRRIYDPFFSTKDTGKGTGMGLSIVHGLVQSYGGFIQCQSQLGVGTLFEILLPVVESSVVEEPEKIVLAPMGTEHILFLDDEKMLVDMNSFMLQRQGYRVTTHTSSVEALKLFENNPDEFDLVITDQTMPEMTGMIIAEKMLAIRPQLPIILCTGYSNMVSEKVAHELGIKGLAHKPITIKEISILIRQVLDKKHICDVSLQDV